MINKGKLAGIGAIALLCTAIVLSIAETNGYGITTTPEGTFLTHKSETPLIPEATQVRKIIVSVDYKQNLRMIEEHIQEKEIDGWSARYYYIVTDPRKATKRNPHLDNPEIRRLVEDYEKATHRQVSF